MILSVSWFIDCDLSVVNFQPGFCPEIRARAVAFRCPLASLRSVIIRRHRSLTRAIIAVITGEAYWTFVVHALAQREASRSRLSEGRKSTPPQGALFIRLRACYT